MFKIDFDFWEDKGYGISLLLEKMALTVHGWNELMNYGSLPSSNM